MLGPTLPVFALQRLPLFKVGLEKERERNSFLLSEAEQLLLAHKMFTGTPPATKRDSRRVSHGKRNSQSDFSLPPIRSQVSVSYGAEHVTMPPLRRTMDTKIGLATQLAPDQVNNVRAQRKEPTDDLELSGDE